MGLKRFFSFSVLFFLICCLTEICFSQEVVLESESEIQSESVSEDETFPFLGQVTASSVNVRSGQGVSFRRIGRLKRGQKLVVVAEKNDWYQVKVPNVNSNYISSSFVHLLDDERGEVTGSHVNVRTGPSTNQPTVNQVHRGDIVYITGVEGDWYQIDPIGDLYGWVSGEFVDFYSNDIELIRPSAIYARTVDRSAEYDAEQKRINERIKNKKSVSATGFVERQAFADFEEIKYKLIFNDEPIYFLNGPDHLLEEFTNYKVQVEGHVFADESANYPYPVIHISSIQLVF